MSLEVNQHLSKMARLSELPVEIVELVFEHLSHVSSPEFALKIAQDLQWRFLYKRLLSQVKLPNVDKVSSSGDINALEHFLTFAKLKYEYGVTKQVQLEYSEVAVRVASRKGHLRVLEWWWSVRHILPFKWHIRETVSPMQIAKYRDQKQVIEFWKKIYPELPTEEQLLLDNNKFRRDDLIRMYIAN